jgi:hypothetical protein
MKSQPFTVADDLRETLEFVAGDLDLVDCWLSGVETILDSARATRLMRRRGFRDGFDLQALDTLHLLLDEAVEQAEELTQVLTPLLEPVRGPGTRYGKRHGVFPRTPINTSKCGSTAGYQQHRRRGQNACPACKWAARVDGRRRRQRSPKLISLPAIAS